MYKVAARWRRGVSVWFSLFHLDCVAARLSTSNERQSQTDTVRTSVSRKKRRDFPAEYSLGAPSVRTRLVIVCCLAFTSVYGEDITLRDGTVFKGASVTDVTPAYISVTHSAGVARVMLKDLTPELQQKYGYIPEKAAKAEAAGASAQQQLAQQQAAEREKFAKQQAAQQQDANVAVAKNKVIDTVRRSAITIRITDILQVADDGVIMGGMNAHDTNGKSILSAERWYLVGYDSSGAVDGAQIGGFTVYPAGTYRYPSAAGGTRTVPRYAASPEIALKLLVEDEARKRKPEDGEPKQKLPTHY